MIICSNEEIPELVKGAAQEEGWRPEFFDHIMRVLRRIHGDGFDGGPDESECGRNWVEFYYTADGERVATLAMGDAESGFTVTSQIVRVDDYDGEDVTVEKMRERFVDYLAAAVGEGGLQSAIDPEEVK